MRKKDALVPLSSRGLSISDGQAVIRYHNGATETISLDQVHTYCIVFHKKIIKPYLPFDAKHPHFPLKKVCKEAMRAKMVKFRSLSVL